MKYIKDWERILLDTTVLCSLFGAENTQGSNSRDSFVKKLVHFLSNNKTSSKSDRVFLISSVTIAELITGEGDSEKIKRVMRVLDSKNVIFVDFDIEVAMQFNSQLKAKLEKKSLHKRAIEIGFLTNELAMAREWITKDYMIAMCGIVNTSDVILTADKNTFYPIIKDVPNSNCVLTYEELFNQSDKFILGYKEDKVEDFISTPIISPTLGNVISDKIMTNEEDAKTIQRKESAKGTSTKIRPPRNV